MEDENTLIPMMNTYSVEEVSEYIDARRNMKSKMASRNQWLEYENLGIDNCKAIWNPYYGIGVMDRSYVDSDNGNLHLHEIYPIIHFGYNKEHPYMTSYSRLMELSNRERYEAPSMAKRIYPFDVSEKTEEEPDLITNEDVLDIFKKTVELFLHPGLGPIQAQEIRVALWNLICIRFYGYAKYADSI